MSDQAHSGPHLSALRGSPPAAPASPRLSAEEPSEATHGPPPAGPKIRSEPPAPAPPQLFSEEPHEPPHETLSNGLQAPPEPTASSTSSPTSQTELEKPLASLSLDQDRGKELEPQAEPVAPPEDAEEPKLQAKPAAPSPDLSPADGTAPGPDESGVVAGEDSLLAQPSYESSPSSPQPGSGGDVSVQGNAAVEEPPSLAPPPIEKDPLSTSPGSSAQPHTSTKKPPQEGAPNPNPRRPIANPPPAHLEHVHSDTRAPEVPFDFNKFLEQMKLRSAVPVGEYVRSFIRNFARRPHTRASQVQLVMDFLKFITDLMTRTAPWSEQTPSEFDNAKEAMEKLVMSRLYNYTFSPAVAAAGKWPIQSDDLERDAVLDQKVALFAWVEEKHLDLPSVGASGGFLEFAIKELLKINHYKAPRDKLICILNVCKVIFGLIRQLKEEASADTFLPLLVLVVLRARCPHLVSNVEYITHFRSPDRLNSEAGYYLTSLQGAITFIEQLDFASLSNITHEEFEQNVEQAAIHMAAEAERKQPAPKEQQFGLLEIAGSGVQTLKGVFAGPSEPQSSPAGPSAAAPPAPKSPSKPEDTRDGAAASGFGALTAPLANASLAEDTRQFFQRTGEAAKMGIGRPIGALNKLWSDVTAPESMPVPVPGPKPGTEGAEKSLAARANEALPPMPSTSPSTSTPPAQRNRLLALFSEGPTASEPASPGGESSFQQGDSSEQANSLKLPLPVRDQDVPNPWAQGQQEQAAKLETLEIMFPNMESGVCRLMLETCHGNLEDTIDKLLAMG